MVLVRHKGSDTSLQGKMSPNKTATSNRGRKDKEDSEWFRDSGTS